MLFTSEDRKTELKEKRDLYRKALMEEPVKCAECDELFNNLCGEKRIAYIWGEWKRVCEDCYNNKEWEDDK